MCDTYGATIYSLNFVFLLAVASALLLHQGTLVVVTYLCSPRLLYKHRLRAQLLGKHFDLIVVFMHIFQL